MTVRLVPLALTPVAIACFDAPPRPVIADAGDATDASDPVDVGDAGSETDADALAPHDADVALAIGRAHACAAIDGAVWCWGDGADGRLGDGSATPGICAPTRVAGASATWLGARHACFAGSDGPWCVGVNTRAQVAALGSPVWWPEPQPPPATSAAGELVVGFDTTCVVAAGSLVCRGERLDGRIGSGDHDDDLEAGAPWLDPRVILGVDGLPGARGPDGAPRVAIGAAFGCAVVADEARCWGSDAHDALGRGGSTALGDPDAAPTTPLPWSPIEIGAGSAFACARGDAGAVACWGDNRRFQAGAETGSTRPSPGEITLPAPARRLALGRRHACALLVDGRVACWGDNTHGQLGVDDTSASAAPVLAPLDGVVALAAGWSATCAARAGGEVMCWGDDGAGVLGRGAAGPAFTATPTPIALAPAAPAPCSGCAPIAALAAGDDHTCALAGDLVWCWGRGGDGRLGRGVFEAAIGAPFPTGSGVTRALALGHATTCGLDDAGAVWCTGGGVDHPVTVALEPAVALAARDDRACALGISGALWCWGPDRVAHEAARDLDVDLPRLALGGDATCARAAGGPIVCWGDNDRGQLGRGVVGDLGRGGASPAPIAAPDGMGAVDALAGAGRRFCALADGVVWCWGDNDRAALGLATTIDHAPTPTPLPLPAPVTSVALGPRASCAIAAGEVHCWGDNRDAALAVPIDLAVTYRAHRVRLPFAAARIAVGDRHACATSVEGHLACWGADDAGQLGAGTAGDATPVPRTLTLPAP